METIFALASAPGKAGVAVVRISGPQAFTAVENLCGSIPISRGLRKIHDLEGALVDEAFILVFRDGKSFTGEDVVELHLHGSIAIISSVLRLLSEQDGLRQAEAGEFTRRAMINGRLDLAQVEGLADLVEAETEAQRKQAIRVFSGHLGEKVSRWRNKLIRAAALIEVTIDFVDEDVPVDVYPEVNALLLEVHAEVIKEADGVRVAERIRQGFEVAIVGAPNVGKSTLLNRLAGREAAITSDIAGTTRDVIEVRMDLEGLPVTFLDTAGLRESADVVEGIGIERGKLRAKQADIRIHLLIPGEKPQLEVSAEDLVVYAKSDLEDNEKFSISAKTGQGVDDLVSKVAEVFRNRTASIGTAMRERHRTSLISGARALDVAIDQLSQGDPIPDILAEDIRAAILRLDSLVGRVDVEDLLDEIFSSFCIGK